MKKIETLSAMRKKKETLFTAPVLFALIAGILMAILCFMGITSTKEDNLFIAESSRTSIDSSPTLPRISSSSHKTPSKQATDRLEYSLAQIQKLSFEEETKETLEEQVRHVNYAIIQTGNDLHLPAAHLQEVSEKIKEHKGQTYTLYSFALYPGKSEQQYLSQLKINLANWTEGTVITSVGSDAYTISLNGVITHQIKLYPSIPRNVQESEILPDETLHRAKNQPARMVIVIDDLGESTSAIKRLSSLPYPVTFAFWPYGHRTKQEAERVFTLGKEILVHMPMEPISKADPGPKALYVSLGKEEIERRLRDAIAKVPHAVGLNNHMGSRFTQSREKTAIVLAQIKQHGLFMLDSLTYERSVFYQEAKKMGIQHYKRNIFLDTKQSKSAVLQQLEKTQNIALLTGEAIAIGHPYPTTLAALEAWEKLRNKNVQLVRLQDLTSH